MASGTSPIELSASERRIILAFAEAAVPAVEGAGLVWADVGEDWFASFKKLLSGMPAEQRRGIRSMFRFLEYSPFLLSLRFSRFSRMDQDARETYLRAWDESRWIGRRLYLLGLKAIVVMALSSLDRVADRLGYDRKCLNEQRAMSNEQ